MSDNIGVMRHSCAHVVAAAVAELFPGAKFGIGPVVENGFYYDIHFPKNISEVDLEKIEKKAKEIISSKVKFEHKEVNIKEAVDLFSKTKQDYKVELLEDLRIKGSTKLSAEELSEVGVSVDTVSLYSLGNFTDLCRGPHVDSVADIGAFKLVKLAGAYWRGDSENPQLQRVYGVCFATQKELDDYLELLEESEKRDHRKIGKEQELFSFHEEGPGFPFWHANGMVLYNQLVDYIKQENKKRGYSEIATPVILNKKLWLTSGHWEKFKENMYFTQIDQKEYAVKPMNCPGGLLIYKNRPHSYKELPIRNAELGTCHRHELSGVLHGLFRVRSFVQDDAHSFCAPEQLNDEIVGMVDYAFDVYNTLGFKDVEVFVATRPEESIGSDEDWERATKALEDALKGKAIDYSIKEGEGAFYGPKIEFNIKDSLGRNWQCGTVQVDYSMPMRFEATYTDGDNKEQTPVMVHRAILGSVERFIGILIEHYAGAYPAWLSPVQVQLVPVSEKHIEGVQKMAGELELEGIRVGIDKADETVGNKVRKAVGQKVPYILVVGDKELSGEDLMVRVRGVEEQEKMSKSEFVQIIISEIKNRK